MTMEDENSILPPRKRTPWNKGKLIGAKPPLLARHVWSIRTKLQSERRARELAMFNPRITASHVLRSTIRTVSAPASSSFRGSLPHPTQPLRTLRVQRRRRLTQHSLPGGPLRLTWAGLAPADRVAGAFPYSITSSARSRIPVGIVTPSAFAALRLTTVSNAIACCTGRSAGLSPLRIRPV
jgi:hypothetical protein